MNRLSMRFPQGSRFAYVSMVVMLVSMPAIVAAGPKEDAHAVIQRWSAAYTANDPEAVVKNYRPDAVLLGTVSPILSEGTEAIRKYFSRLKGTGNKNRIGETRTLVLSDNAVLVAGFYEFTRMKDGQPLPGPARFTMLLLKEGDEWLIAHHHSSPHVEPTK